MGWLNTLLNVAEVGLELGQLAQLQGIKDQQTATLMGQLSEAARKSLIESAKNELFNIKQFANAAIKLQSENPKSAAGAIRYSQLRLDDYGITPDVFPDLKDKEYCVEVRQLLADNDKIFMDALSVDEQMEVVSVAKTAVRMPDYNYYVGNHSNVQEYRSAKALMEDKKYKKLGGVNARIDNSKIGQLSYYVMILALVAIPLFTYRSFGSFIFIAVFSWGLAWILWRIVKNRKKMFDMYHSAKKKVETLREKVNLEYFQQLEDEFGSDYQHVYQLQQEANKKVTGLFADIDLAQALLQ